MDGYLSKPIDRIELFDTVEQRVDGKPAAAESTGSPKAFDYAEALARLDGDEQLFAELARVFVDDCPRQLGAIEAAIAANDTDRLRTAAHELKGAAANFGANGVVDATRALETIASQNAMAAAPAVWQRLQTETTRLIGSLTSLYSPASSKYAS